MSVQPISQFPAYPQNGTKNDRNRSNSYDFSQTKRQRTLSISGRLRTASDLEELGLISSVEKNHFKDLIISQDETLAQHMDNYEKGDKDGLINYLKHSLGNSNIDLMDGLDYDFMNSLTNILPSNGPFDDFNYLINDPHSSSSFPLNQNEFDQRLRRGSLDSFISDFPLDDMFSLPNTGLPSHSPPSVHTTSHHTNSSHLPPPPSSMTHSSHHSTHHSSHHSSHNSPLPPYPLSHNSLANSHSSHPSARPSTHTTASHHHNTPVDMYGMNNSQYGTTGSSQYGSSSGNINYSSSLSSHKTQKKSLRGMNDSNDRVELSAYASYAAHLQSDNKSKNLHKNINTKHEMNNIYPSSSIHSSSNVSHSMPSQSSKNDLSSSNSHHLHSSVSNTSSTAHSSTPSSSSSLSSSSLPLSSSSSTLNSLSTPQSIGIDPSLLPSDTPQRLPGYIGAYDPEQRKLRIEKFLEKRQQRVWARKVKYDVRKNFADSRLRIKGRFVKKEDEDVMRELMSL